MRAFTADFETTTNPNDCRVWAWAVTDVQDTNYFQYGNSLETFFDWMEKNTGSVVYFHNEKFDGSFLINHLFRIGFKHVAKLPIEPKENPKLTERQNQRRIEKYLKMKESFYTYNTIKPGNKTFETLISDMGQFYSLKIIFERKNKRLKSIKILDSLKILPFSIEQMAKAFDLPMKKLKIDYKAFRPVGYELTVEEIEYIRNDITIAALALREMFKMGLEKMTIGSNALHDYKERIGGKERFRQIFPDLSDSRLDEDERSRVDADIRRAYKGGYSFANPIFQNRPLGRTLVCDINSLYPWAMRNCLLPWGEPVPFTGKYEYDEYYPLYIQQISCHFELKPGHLPTVQIKGSRDFVPTQYLTSSKIQGVKYDHDLPVVLCMTNIDLQLFLEHYNVYDLDYIDGWKFQGAHGMFDDYIDHWIAIKIKADEEGNKPYRTIAKLMQNSCYGKFGAAIKGASKYPYLDDGVLKYVDTQEEARPGVYIPVAAFITAYAREKTIRTAQSLYDYFAYADTDSVHLILPLPDEIMKMDEKQLAKLTTKDLQNYGLPIPDSMEIHPRKLGAWKIEQAAHRSFFIRSKTYIEDNNPPETWNEPVCSSAAQKEFFEDMEIEVPSKMLDFSKLYDHSKLHVTCAGMPKRCHEYVTWDNFRMGTTYPGKLVPKQVKGGIVLTETEYTIM